MAPQKWRGTIVSVNEMMIAGGFLLGAPGFLSQHQHACSLNHGLLHLWFSLNHGLLHLCSRPLAANFVDGLFASTPGGWRYMFGFASIIAALQLLCMSFMPRSPRWLLLQGRRDEAHASLVQIYGGSQRRTRNTLLLST